MRFQNHEDQRFEEVPVTDALQACRTLTGASGRLFFLGKPVDVTRDVTAGNYDWEMGPAGGISEFDLTSDRH